MSNQELIELKGKKNKSKADENILLNSGLFMERLNELKSENQDMSWSELARKLSQEFNMKINSRTLENKYLNEMSMEIQIDGYAEKQFTKHVQQLAKRYEQTEKLADKFLEAMNKIVDKMTEVDADDLSSLTSIISLIKPYESLNKALMQQLQFVRDEQNKIMMKLNKSKKEVSDDDIRAKSKKYVKDLLELYAAQGKIKIYDSQLIK